MAILTITYFKKVKAYRHSNIKVPDVLQPLQKMRVQMLYLMRQARFSCAFHTAEIIDE